MSSLVIFTPTVLVALLATVYYQVGLETTFNEKISNTISETVKVAEAYLQEHKQNIRADTLAIANGIYKNLDVLSEDQDLLLPFLNKQAELRGLSEVILLRKNEIIAQTNFSYSLIFEKLPEKELKLADQTKDVVIIEDDSNDKVRGLLKLEKLYNGYLLVGRFVDSEIIEHLKRTQGSQSQYNILLNDFKAAQDKLQIAFILVSAILSIITILIGIRLARVIARPINRLVEATELISEGEFNIRVPEKEGKDEIAILSRAFNQMTETLSSQRDELIQINDITEERRRFIEMVLSEISAGVIAINPKGKITLYNTSAALLLDINDQSIAEIIDSDYLQLFPESRDLLEHSKSLPDKIVHDQISIIRTNNRLHLLVKIGTQKNRRGSVESYVITFDDITSLVSAQRSAAWADVARRVAHEIKNPLTPIQLSAERLRKKYSNQISSDTQNFTRYIDTIVKHVTDIGNIVQEFVDLGNIAQPKLAKTDLSKVIREAIFSQECTHKSIQYEFEEDIRIDVLCDAGKINQVLINLFKNAAESIKTKMKENEELKGRIIIKIIKMQGDFIETQIADNGMGFEVELLDRICEPYVTTKSEGTGLGLAIVKKIIEDHSGKLTIENTNNGACISFSLKKYVSK